MIHNSQVSENIDPSKIKYSPTVRLLDPNGRVFFYNDMVYRGIYVDRTDFVRSLFDNGTVDELIEKKLLINTCLTEKRLEGFGLILQHDRVEVQTRPTEWSLVTYLEAAKSYLKLFHELHKRGLTLIDGHTANFSLAPSGQVVWHDFGSIIPTKTTGLHGLSTFLSYFYYPLMLYRHFGSFALVRRLGLHCSKDDYYRLTHPRLFPLVDAAIRNGNHYWAKGIKRLYLGFTNEQLPPDPIDKVVNYLKRKTRRTLIDAHDIDNLIVAIDKKISHISVKYQNTQWGNYYGTLSIEALGKPRGKRQEAIFQLLKDIKPERVLDLGANEGVFSHLAYQVSPCVISSDYDETAVAKHAHTLLSMNNDSHIYPIILDVTNADDAVMSRYRSHTVMALALTHHLRLGQSFPFHFIAKILSGFTEKVLITEFMPNGLSGARKPNDLPTDYTLDKFIEAFKIYFHSVEVIDYEIEANYSPRTLVVCKKDSDG